MSRQLSPRVRNVLAVSVVGLMLFGPAAYHLVRLALEQRRLDRHLAALAVQRERLTKEAQRLQSDPTYIEGLIRSTFKLARPGEYVVPLETPREKAR